MSASPRPSTPRTQPRPQPGASASHRPLGVERLDDRLMLSADSVGSIQLNPTTRQVEVTGTDANELLEIVPDGAKSVRAVLSWADAAWNLHTVEGRFPAKKVDAILWHGQGGSVRVDNRTAIPVRTGTLVASETISAPQNVCEVSFDKGTGQVTLRGTQFDDRMQVVPDKSGKRVELTLSCDNGGHDSMKLRKTQITDVTVQGNGGTDRLEDPLGLARGTRVIRPVGAGTSGSPAAGNPSTQPAVPFPAGLPGNSAAGPFYCLDPFYGSPEFQGLDFSGFEYMSDPISMFTEVNNYLWSLPFPINDMYQSALEVDAFNDSFDAWAPIGITIHMIEYDGLNYDSY